MKPALLTAALLASLGSAALAQTGVEHAQSPADAALAQAHMEAAAQAVQASVDDWRNGNYEGWIARYHPQAVVVGPGYELHGRSQINRVYRPLFDAGQPEPNIVESGWTGEAIYIVQNEYFPDGSFAATTYAEYTVTDGKIVAVYARYAS